MTQGETHIPGRFLVKLCTEKPLLWFSARRVECGSETEWHRFPDGLRSSLIDETFPATPFSGRLALFCAAEYLSFENRSRVGGGGR